MAFSTVFLMALKVFDLQCAAGHVFEGWFGSHADYDSQHARGLIACPLCGDASITKKLSAPRLNVSGAREPAMASAASTTAGAPAAPAAAAPVLPPQMQAQMLRQLREMVRQTENVGDQFAREARRIHHGDAPERTIRGVASAQERRELVEEGIAVAPIPALLDDEHLQ